MEPMGVVVFSVFMISSFVQVLVESIERLFAGSSAAISIPFTSMLVMWATILVKGMVWLWCRRKKNTSVKALAQDAENDWLVLLMSTVMFSSLFFSLVRLTLVTL
jgi:divalent metal cation (Fe/Co/Zn/Cd) transporter